MVPLTNSGFPITSTGSPVQPSLDMTTFPDFDIIVISLGARLNRPTPAGSSPVSSFSSQPLPPRSSSFWKSSIPLPLSATVISPSLLEILTSVAPALLAFCRISIILPSMLPTNRREAFVNNLGLTFAQIVFLIIIPSFRDCCLDF